MTARPLLQSFALVLGCCLNTFAGESDFPAVGDKAADFTLKSIEGKAVKLHDITAKGPAVLVVLRGYPGYQCPACTAQVASLASKAKDLKDAPVLLVYPGPADDLKARAKEFVGKKTLPEGFTLLLDPDYEFTNQYRLRWEGPSETAYPSTFVVDTDNTIRYARVSKTHGGRAPAAEVIGALGTLKAKAK